MDSLQPLDQDFVDKTLSSPPFVTIEGVHNVRDLGSYCSSYPGQMTRPHLLLRAAELSAIKSTGKAKLKELGITKVFDLRSDTEIAKYKAPLPSIEGIEIVAAPVFQTEDYSPSAMAKRYELYASGKTEAFMELYSQILDHGGQSFGTILRHIRDHPQEGCVFHCTAGKDRTGVIAAIILKIAGVSDADIAQDYALTRVGREPAREMILARLSKEPLFATNNEAAMNMFSCRDTTMLAFLNLLETKYGGAITYVKDVIGLTEGDITTIRKNLLVPVPQPGSSQ